MSTENVICKNIKDLKKIFKTLTEKGGLLDRRSYKVPENLKNITDIELEEINKQQYYTIELSRTIRGGNDKRYIIVMIMGNIQLLNEKKKKMECVEIMRNLPEITKTSLVVIYTLGSKEEGGKSYLQNLNGLENHYIKKECFKFYDVRLFYSTNELLTNKMHHKYQPSIIKILRKDEDQEEINKLYDKLTISDFNQLNKYCIDDPVVKFHGGLVGDIFYCETCSQNSGVSINYRLVTNNSMIK